MVGATLTKTRVLAYTLEVVIQHAEGIQILVYLFKTYFEHNSHKNIWSQFFTR